MWLTSEDAVDDTSQSLQYAGERAISDVDSPQHIQFFVTVTSQATNGSEKSLVNFSDHQKKRLLNGANYDVASDLRFHTIWQVEKIPYTHDLHQDFRIFAKAIQHNCFVTFAIMEVPPTKSNSQSESVKG